MSASRPGRGVGLGVGRAGCRSFPRNLPWQSARARRAREAKRDQEQAIDFLRFWLCKTGDNRSGRAARQWIRAQARLPAQGPDTYVHDVFASRFRPRKAGAPGPGGIDLWHHEHEAGRQEGQKDGPSVIVLAVERDADGATVVTVLPITHSAPADPASGVEIPIPIKRHLGLDDEPSWIIVSEGNELVWPVTTCASCRTLTATTMACCRRDSSIRYLRPSSPSIKPIGVASRRANEPGTCHE